MGRYQSGAALRDRWWQFWVGSGICGLTITIVLEKTQMESRGPLECTIGKYQIFHRMTDGLNRNKPSGYYQLIGPGADSSWIYDLDLAVKTAKDLEEKHR